MKIFTAYQPEPPAGKQSAIARTDAYDDAAVSTANAKPGSSVDDVQSAGAKRHSANSTRNGTIAFRCSGSGRFNGYVFTTLSHPNDLILFFLTLPRYTTDAGRTAINHYTISDHKHITKSGSEHTKSRFIFGIYVTNDGQYG